MIVAILNVMYNAVHSHQSPSPGPDHLTMACNLSTGEVHLETCIKDLQERFARCELQVSAPLVAFRESVFSPEEVPDAVPKPVKVRGA